MMTSGFSFFSCLLAQSNTPLGPDGQPVSAAEQPDPAQFFVELPINDIWDTIVNISWAQALVCVAFAMIYLVYGWRVFKILVALNFVVLGLIVGRLAGERLGSPQWGGILGSFTMLLLTYPFMKYCVSALGALAGAILGAAIWRTAQLPDELIFCGAVGGLVAGGFLAFTSFKYSIIMFTSLQGAVFLSIGSLALLNEYPNFSGYLAEAIYTNVSILPLTVIVPTLFGVWFQKKLIKEEKNWAIPD